jgi:DNA-binding IclR family transcriptional regulator
MISMVWCLGAPVMDAPGKAAAMMSESAICEGRRPWTVLDICQTVP